MPPTIWKRASAGPVTKSSTPSPTTKSCSHRFSPIELVLAGATERTALLELASTGRIAPDRRLRTLRGKQITVRMEDAAFHRDGSLVERSAAAVEFSLSVEPASVRYLVE